MIGGPFREMFVELSDALFATLKGMGEQAVREAQRRPGLDFKPSPTDALGSNAVASVLCERFGWARINVGRDPRNRSIAFGVKLRCGHWHRLDVEEYALYLCAHPATNVLDQIAVEQERNPRSCYCTPRESP